MKKGISLAWAKYGASTDALQPYHMIQSQSKSHQCRLKVKMVMSYKTIKHVIFVGYLGGQ